MATTYLCDSLILKPVDCSMKFVVTSSLLPLPVMREQWTMSPVPPTYTQSTSDWLTSTSENNRCVWGTQLDISCSDINLLPSLPSFMSPTLLPSHPHNWTLAVLILTWSYPSFISPTLLPSSLILSSPPPSYSPPLLPHTLLPSSLILSSPPSSYSPPLFPRTLLPSHPRTLLPSSPPPLPPSQYEKAKTTFLHACRTSPSSDMEGCGHRMLQGSQQETLQYQLHICLYVVTLVYMYTLVHTVYCIDYSLTAA